MPLYHGGSSTSRAALRDQQRLATNQFNRLFINEIDEGLDLWEERRSIWPLGGAFPTKHLCRASELLGHNEVDMA